MTDFLSFAAAYGLIIRTIEYDRWRRVPTTDHPKKRNGAYIHFGRMALIQNWAQMPEPIAWKDDSNARPINKAEFARQRARAEKVLHEGRQEAARKAQAILKECVHAQHAYLDRKNFSKLTGNVYRPETDNLLVIPMYAGRHLVGCQMIDIDGQKKFLHGQQAKGAEFVIRGGDLDAWCEGWATGMSVHLCARKRLTVHICFSAGNLAHMAKRGIVIADNDVSRAGEDAAKATGLQYFLPPQVGQDFNDLHNEVGIFRASVMLQDFLRSCKKSLQHGRKSITVHST